MWTLWPLGVGQVQTWMGAGIGAFPRSVGGTMVPRAGGGNGRLERYRSYSTCRDRPERTASAVSVLIDPCEQPDIRPLLRRPFKLAEVRGVEDGIADEWIGVGRAFPSQD